MCGETRPRVIDFAIRAIAAGAGGKELAVWALREGTKDEEERREREAFEAAHLDQLMRENAT